MNILYADDTYAKASKVDTQASIHLFGGIVVSREVESAIIAVLQSVKSAYTHQNMPIKWNFKDPSIKKKYEEFDRIAEYHNMLRASREWRLEIFRKINGLKYTVIASAIKSFSSEKEVLKKVKDDLNSFCFENVLMRVGIDAKETGGYWQCVIDWPPDNDSRPFDQGYYKLYHFGKASSTKPSICGPLCQLGFSHSLHFTRCNHSPMMQLADLILGAIRDHLECRIQGRDSCVGSECVDLFYDHFRNADGVVPRFGVIASSGSKGLTAHIAEIFSRKANKPQEPPR